MKQNFASLKVVFCQICLWSTCVLETHTRTHTHTHTHTTKMLGNHSKSFSSDNAQALWITCQLPVGNDFKCPKHHWFPMKEDKPVERLKSKLEKKGQKIDKKMMQIWNQLFVRSKLFEEIAEFFLNWNFSTIRFCSVFLNSWRFSGEQTLSTIWKHIEAATEVFLQKLNVAFFKKAKPMDARLESDEIHIMSPKIEIMTSVMTDIQQQRKRDTTQFNAWYKSLIPSKLAIKQWGECLFTVNKYHPRLFRGGKQRLMAICSKHTNCSCHYVP